MVSEYNVLNLVEKCSSYDAFVNMPDMDVDRDEKHKISGLNRTKMKPVSSVKP